MAALELKAYLDRNGVAYRSIRHSPSFTAQQTAQAAHIKGKEVAKTVVVDLDGQKCMAVLPAHCRLDLTKLRIVTGTDHAELVSELELNRIFPDCETGAMSPFGNLYGIEVWVDSELARDREIAFNAGTHTEMLRIAYEDYEDLVHPCVANIAIH